MTKGIAFQAKIDLHEGMVPPDVWMSAAGLIPPHDFIVSRNRDGSIASRYGDEKWDRTPIKLMAVQHGCILRLGVMNTRHRSNFPFIRDKVFSVYFDMEKAWCSVG